MNVIIIEDELPAIEKLVHFIKQYDANINIIAKIQSVNESIIVLKNLLIKPDLIFLDIQLTDGNSFEIFEKINIDIPIIFITAYNEYAIKAFELHSIDFLLKPLSYEALVKSLDKLKNMKQHFILSHNNININTLSKSINTNAQQFKHRFIVKIGDHIKYITIDEIALFYAEGRDIFVVTNLKSKFIIDYTMDELEEILDKNLFFRINRTYIFKINGITDVVQYSGSKLKIKSQFIEDDEIFVSRSKVQDFKNWFDGIVG